MSAYRREIIKQIAKTCHNVNLAYCEGIEDHSQVAWEDAPETSRISAIRGVEYAIANPEATPEKQHEAWLKDKEEQGFVYGPIKDLEAKEHPCMVPYLELPKEQRLKDHLFLAVVRSLSGPLNYIS